ncbi:hypothetical protein LMG22931_07113 [Paraburkholderia nemoris]|nr:hypothetical protein LMG22931_07113 [Paraburkholderia nemoris]
MFGFLQQLPGETFVARMNCGEFLCVRLFLLHQARGGRVQLPLQVCGGRPVNVGPLGQAATVGPQRRQFGVARAKLRAQFRQFNPQHFRAQVGVAVSCGRCLRLLYGVSPEPHHIVQLDGDGRLPQRAHVRRNFVGQIGNRHTGETCVDDFGLDVVEHTRQGGGVAGAQARAQFAH